MKNRAWLVISAFLALSAYGIPACATFTVVEEVPIGRYGNGQCPRFHRAITGGGGPLTKTEEEGLALILPEKDYNRYYGKVGVSFSTLVLDQIKNRASGIDKLGKVNIKRASRNQVGLQLAIGYAWSKNFRGDLEYFVTRNLNYTANPALTGVGVPPRVLTAIVKNNTLLANLYYDFNGIYRFRPYVTAGIGASVNSVQATVNPAPNTTIVASNTFRTIRMAYDVGLGMRVGMFSRWFLDVNYRYVILGNGIGLTPVSGYKLLSSYSMNTVAVAAIYLF